MEKEYIMTLRVKADVEEIEQYGDIRDMIYDSMLETPLSFDIEKCREVSK